jgi:phosphate transport system substrate-binding protein
MQMRRSWWIIGLFVVLTLLVAGCASPAPAPAADEVAEEAATEAPAEEAAAEAGEAVSGELPMVDPLEVTGDIVTAGSSTVFPLSEAMAERFIDEGYSGQITVDSIGSGAGYQRFCESGETDISNASRAIRDSEIESCQAIGREPIEFRVGTDAIAVTVNPENDWLAEGVTMEELAYIFSADYVNWSDVNPEWPEEAIQRFAPGTDSGTYDFFVEEVMEPVYEDEAEDKFLGAQSLQLSEDDNVLVQGIEGSRNGIGFFGYAYYLENQDELQVLALDGVTADDETVDSGEYPLARPLFLYSDAGIITSKPQVGAFLNFYLTYVNEEIERVGYFPASEDALNAARAELASVLAQ